MSGSRIGIFGGSFNPIHNGHMAIAKAAKEFMMLDRVIFVPAGQPPHKDSQSLASGPHRCAMVEMATEDHQDFFVSRFEIDSPALSFTFKTIDAFRAQSSTEDAFFFIMGADSVMDLRNWRQFPKLAKMCRFIAVGRPEIAADDFWRQIKLLREHHGVSIDVVDMPLMPISASAIRDMIAAGKDTSGFLSPKVADYIHQNRLYGG